jgi:nitrite reductase/ring-hydroxylating ferredoxin subunit/hemoglobin-like flavoprotein
MSTPVVDVSGKRGAEDAGLYFRYMADFVGFTREDAETVKQTRPIIEKHLPEIVAKFYAHLLRYPPTRSVFAKKDGSIDQAYVELRMRHLTNFWLRTAGGTYDDDYARYVDYVGRAHTSHGADPHIYVAERYVIGQVGFIQHAFTVALMQELAPTDPDFAERAIDAWDKLLMVILEMLSRAYGNERQAERFDPLVAVDDEAVAKLAADAFAQEHASTEATPYRDVIVAPAAEIPEGHRKIVQIDGLSIGVFHHNGAWYAVRNRCLHRGGPVATGSLEGAVLTCPWHGFQYDITSGQLLVDPSARLDEYAITIRDGQVHLLVPAQAPVQAPGQGAPPAAPPSPLPVEERQRHLQPNEFRASDLQPGQARLVHVDGQEVAVFNVGGRFYATAGVCTHAGGPLSEGELDGQVVECPVHGSRFDVTTGQVIAGPAREPIATYKVVVLMGGEIVRVLP